MPSASVTEDRVEHEVPPHEKIRFRREEITDLANGAKGTDVNGYRAEFVQMVGLAALLNPDHSAGGKSKFDDPTLPQNRNLGAPQPSN